MSSQLRIGLSPCFFHSDPQRPIFKGKTLVYYEETMARWLQEQGAFPVLLPRPHGLLQINEILGQIDGLLLQAGSDVSPLAYGENPLKPEWSGDAPRDDIEILLIQECMKRNIPILGICRGLQILNVALGGTLYQDIGTQLPRALVHRKWEVYDQLFHEVDWTKGGYLEKLYPKGPRKINTIHHQAIKTLGSQLVIEATSPKDGIIEAIRIPSDSQYVLAVQWHPEFHATHDKTLVDSSILLNDFLKAVSKKKETSSA